MSLLELDLPIRPIAPSPTAQRLIEEADRYWSAFLDASRNRRLPRFVPSDPTFLYSALSYILENDLTQGRVFCEWGCGFGVGSCLAAELGFESCGIEIEKELVLHSRELAKRFNLPVEFLHESYLPEGYNSYKGIGGFSLMKPPRARRHLPNQYFGMDRDIEDIDVFYVYPWPEEQEMMLDLFDAVAGEETLLLAYYGHGDLNLYQKKWDDR